MELKSPQFRAAMRNPPKFVEDCLQPAVQQDGGNPQKPLFEACLRRYFRSGRRPDVAFDYLATQMAKSKSEMRHANETAVRSMLIRFFAWDTHESQPSVYLERATKATIGRHSLWLSPSLLYSLGEGLLLRHLWTERDFSLQRPYARLVAAGFLGHADGVHGKGRVRQIEFWHVRTGKTRGWRAQDLRGAIPAMTAVLDQIEQSISGPGSSGAAA